jgi:hypothetical protein
VLGGCAMRRSRLPRLVLVGMTAIATVVLSSAPAMAEASTWKLGYYTPSVHGTLSFSDAAAPVAGVATFDFTNQANTALLVTTHGASKGSTLGDLTGSTVSATFEISGATSPFIYFGEPSCGNTISTVRLFFQTSNAGGFNETHYWWSNPLSAVLANTGGTITLTASLNDPGAWSDFFGHFGNDPAFPGFFDAVSNVTTIGLSFGGGCFFENGVGTTDGSGTFTLDSFIVSS